MLAERDLSDARAAEISRRGVVNGELPGHDRSMQRLARTIGLLYLLLTVFGPFASIVLWSLVEPGAAAATADNVLGSRWLFASSLAAWIAVVAADTAIAVMLYVLLRPVSVTLALLAAALRIVHAAVLGAVLPHLFNAYLLLTDAPRGADLNQPRVQTMALSALETFRTGFLLALAFLGVHLLALGVLLHRSRYIPGALGVLVAAAGVGYVLASLGTIFVSDRGEPASLVLLASAVLGELGLTAWLLAKGVTVGRRHRRPGAPRRGAAPAVPDRPGLPGQRYTAWHLRVPRPLRTIRTSGVSGEQLHEPA